MKNLIFNLMTYKLHYAILLLGILIGNTIKINAQVNVGFTQRTSQDSPDRKIYTVKGDFTMLGNTCLTPQNYGVAQNNNNQYMSYVDTDNDPNTWNSSSSTLTLSTENGALPSCSNIVYAGLYWTGKSSPDQIFDAQKQIQNGTQVVNYNLTATHDINIVKTNYKITVSRNDPSSNNRNPVYTFTGNGNTYTFNFFNSSASNRVTLSVNGAASINIPVSINAANTEVTLLNPYEIVDGTAKITVIKLFRSAATNLSSTDTRNTSTSEINVSATIPTYTTITKQYDKRVISLKGPNSSSYSQFIATANDIYYPKGTEDDIYCAYKEITEYVKLNGIGEYFAADMALLEGDPGGTGYSGGWGIIVVYENFKMKYRDITIFDGYAYVNSSNTSGYTLPVSGFNTVQTGTVGAKIGMMASEGDVSFAGDYFQIQKNSDASFLNLNHSGNITTNFFNSSINAGSDRNPNLQNNTGIDICMFTVPNNGNFVIGNNQTSTTFKYGTSGDTYSIFAIALAVDAYIPESEAVLTATTINNVPAIKPFTSLPGQEIGCRINIRNLGTEPIESYKLIIPIPYNTTYVPGSALGSILFTPLPTPNNIYLDETLGTNGSLVWDFGTLPQPLTPTTTLARLTFKLKATEDCSLLKNTSCGSKIVVNGYTSGIGAITGIVFDNNKMIEGFTENGACIGAPEKQTLTVNINSTSYVGANCISIPLVQNFTFCNKTSVLVSEIASNFPSGTRFYNTFPVNSNSIQFTNSNPIPLLEGTSATYYAIPPTANAGCNFAFTISKCKDINANDDIGINIVSSIGGISLSNVLVNDTLNSAPFTSTEVNLTFVGATNPGITFVGSSVAVAAGTPAGNYSLTYKICEAISPKNCDTANISVKVLAASIIAIGDSGASINSLTGGTAFTNVLSNDTLNGTPVLASQVVTYFVSATSSGISLSGNDVIVAAGTPAGSYTLTYKICEVLNDSNCDTAVVTVTVYANSIIANDDTVKCLDEVNGGISFTNIISNDTLNGFAVTTENVNLTFVSATNSGITLSGTNVFVAPGTQAGSYTLIYKICEVLNTVNCSQGIISVIVNAVPTGLKCYEIATFNPSTCLYDITGTQPTAPTGLACYEVATFNPKTCLYDVTGTQPVKPNVACYETLGDFNNETCTWTVTGAQIIDKPTLDDVIGQCTATATLATTKDNCGETIIGTPQNPITYDIEGEYIITWVFESSDKTVSVAALQNVTVTATNADTDGKPGYAECNADIDLYKQDDYPILNSLLPEGTASGGTWIDEVNPYSIVDVNGEQKFNPYQINTGNYELKYLTTNGACSSTVKVVITVDDDCVLLPACNFLVHNAFSPNGDGTNEVFIIENIDQTVCFPTNTVEIYNRWGVLVFETNQYDNSTRVFRGISEGRATVNKSAELPTGTYFYIIQYTDGKG
ncbi:gliding motility-associated C-terminal domain-containing protein, partial [Flavobacterium luteum]